MVGRVEVAVAVVVGIGAAVLVLEHIVILDFVGTGIININDAVAIHVATGDGSSVALRSY